MNELRKVKDLYDKLRFILSSQQKRNAVVVALLSVVAALLEMLGVSVIVPIINIMFNPSVMVDKWYMKPFVQLFHLDTDMKMVWFVCILAVLIYAVKNLYFIFFNWISMKFSYKVQKELSSRILRAYMRQGYIFFVNSNSARLLQGIGSDVSSIYYILNIIFTMLIQIFTILCIGVLILFQSRDIALLLIILVVICFALIQLIFRKSMSRNGKKRRDLQARYHKISMEAIYGNKEILVTNKQEFFVDSYSEMMDRANRVSLKVDMGERSPAYIIEMVCITGLLLAVSFKLGSASDTLGLLGQLSTIAISAFRLLPALGKITSGVNSIIMSTSQLSAAYDTLKEVKELEEQDEEKVTLESRYRDKAFDKELQIRELCYHYPGVEENVIDQLNLCIQKGQSVAFIGTSGAGKTTLSDIILGLLKPVKGRIFMDGIDIEELGGEWSRIVGYVPQMVYILDDTIRNNIAFGEDPRTIDDEQIWDALKMAQLDEFIRELPRQLDSVVGERGIRFSGGQRQRLAIARALYRNPEILVLDEATSALDNETEVAVMESIEALQGYKTLIIVAHRLTTVRQCDVIYEVQNGKAVVRDKAEIFGS